MTGVQTCALPILLTSAPHRACGNGQLVLLSLASTQTHRKIRSHTQSPPGSALTDVVSYVENRNHLGAGQTHSLRLANRIVDDDDVFVHLNTSQLHVFIFQMIIMMTVLLSERGRARASKRI